MAHRDDLAKSTPMEVGTNDPWRHRSNGMKCASCMWFVVKVKECINTTCDNRGCLGRCRKNAPSIKGFVPVFETDWCGDHRLDENKI